MPAFLFSRLISSVSINTSIELCFWLILFLFCFSSQGAAMSLRSFPTKRNQNMVTYSDVFETVSTIPALLMTSRCVFSFSITSQTNVSLRSPCGWLHSEDTRFSWPDQHLCIGSVTNCIIANVSAAFKSVLLLRGTNKTVIKRREIVRPRARARVRVCTRARIYARQHETRTLV